MNLFYMSITGACLIVAIVLIRSIARNKIPKRAFMILWSIVLLRLLVPVSLNVTVPNKGLPQKISNLMNSSTTRHENSNRLNDLSYEEQVHKEMLNNTSNDDMFSSESLIEDSNAVYEVQEVASPDQTSQHVIKIVVLSIWAIGCLIASVWSFLSYRNVYKTLQESLPMKDEWLSAWLLEKHIKRTIQIRSSDQIKSPLTYGIIRPKIVVPKMMDLTQKDDVLFMMEHEFVHIKRFDNLRKMIMQGALCIHWFNPMVWVMQRYFQRDIEVTCDERVLRLLGEENKEAYAFTLIHFAEKSTYDFLVYSGFGKNVIQERIVSIMKYKKKNICGIAVAAVLVLGSTAVFAHASIKDDSAVVEEDTQQNSSASESGSYAEDNMDATDFDQDAYYQEAKKAGAWFSMDSNPEDYNKFKTYEPYGITYNEKDDEIYFDGKIVREFYDPENGTYFARTNGIAYPKDSIDVYVVYESGKLTGLRAATKEEYDKRSEERRQYHDMYVACDASSVADNGPMDMSYFTETKCYEEYKKLGLVYDKKRESVIYQDKVVGYFKDEFEENKYTFFANLNDPKAEIGVCAKRDEQYKLLELEVISLDDVKKGETVLTEESNAYRNRFYEDISGEYGEPDPTTLEKYESYGVTYDAKRNVWSYQKRDIAILVDENNEKYLDESVAEHGGSYVLVKRDDKGEIADLEFIDEEKALELFNK